MIQLFDHSLLKNAALLSTLIYSLSLLLLSRSCCPPCILFLYVCVREPAHCVFCMYICMCLFVGFTCTRTFLQQYAFACVRVCVCACVLSSIYFHLCGKEMQSKHYIDEIHKSHAHSEEHPAENIINLLFVSVV